MAKNDGLVQSQGVDEHEKGGHLWEEEGVRHCSLSGVLMSVGSVYPCDSSRERSEKPWHPLRASELG